MRVTSAVSRSSSRSTASCSALTETPAHLHQPVARLEAVGERPRPRLDDPDDVDPARQRLVESNPHRLGVHPLGHLQLEVLRLARRAGRRGVGVADPGVRMEACREGHRYVGPTQCPLERPLEVTARREPQPPALGVADAQLLDGRVGSRALGDALTGWGHARRLSGVQPRVRGWNLRSGRTIEPGVGSAPSVHGGRPERRRHSCEGLVSRRRQTSGSRAGCR